MTPHFYNVIPIFPGHEDFAISEILRKKREAGLDRFLVSLSFHPQTTPAHKLIPVLCERFRKVREGVAGSGVSVTGGSVTITLYMKIARSGFAPFAFTVPFTAPSLTRS